MDSLMDRIRVIMAVPVDTALPGDVQGVALRRRAIELMQEVAVVDENTVRYDGFSDQCTTSFGDNNAICMWQHNLIAVLFRADGKALEGVCGPVVHTDSVTRLYSSASIVRNEYARA